MARFTTWLRANADGFVALLVAITVGVLAVLDVLGTSNINAAILLVLALLAATLLKDRQSASKALIDTSAVRQLSGVEVGQEHAEAQRHTEKWTFKGGTGTYLRAVTLKECVEHAREEQRPLRMQLEIIDPPTRHCARRMPSSGCHWHPVRTAPGNRGPSSALARSRSPPSWPPAGIASTSPSSRSRWACPR